MRNLLHGLIYALNFFTSIPTIQTKEYNKEAEKYIASFAPMAGLFLGTTCVSLFFLLSLKIDPIFSGVITAVFYLMFYGFLHIEAFADMVDGYYASLSGKDPLEIMKDPHSGALGIFWSVGLILLKVIAITYLLGVLQQPLIFIGVLILSRLSFFYIFKFFTLHEKSAFPLKMQQSIKTNTGLYFFLFYLFLVFLLGKSIFFSLVFISFISLFFAYQIKKTVGFINGDVLGSVLELTETTLLLWVIWIVL